MSANHSEVSSPGPQTAAPAPTARDRAARIAAAEAAQAALRRARFHVALSWMMTLIAVVAASILSARWARESERDYQRYVQFVGSRIQTHLYFERARGMIERAERLWYLGFPVPSAPHEDLAAAIRSNAESALQELQTVFDQSPHYFEAHELAARAYFLLHDYERAADHIRRLVAYLSERRFAPAAERLLPWMYALRWLRRWCALSTQELERERALFTTHVDAVRETRAVLDRREKPLWSGEIEGLLHVLEDRADALAPVADFAATMDQLDPTLWSTLLLRAWSLLAAGDTDRALEATSELARRFPRLAEAHALRARALDIAGRRDEAIAAWSDAIAADPEFAEAYLARSRLTAHTDPDAATRDRARAFDLSPALRKIVEP